VRNEEVLLRVNEQRNILYEIRKRKDSWIGHILRRNYLLQRVIEGKIKGQTEVTRRRGRRRRKLLDDLKERWGYSNAYPNLKEEALDRPVWRAGFGRGFWPAVRQTTEWNEWIWNIHSHIRRLDTNFIFHAFHTLNIHIIILYLKFSTYNPIFLFSPIYI